MSNIAIHNIEIIAARRLARVAQLAALPPQPHRHTGDHWHRNRAAKIITRKPRNDAADYEPWAAMAEQNILSGVRGTPGATETHQHAVPYPCVVKQITLWLEGHAAGSTIEWDVSSNEYGTIWHSSAETPQLTAAGTGPAKYSLTHEPNVVIPTPGCIITLSLTLPASSDGWLNVRIQPLQQWLRGIA